MYKKREVWLRKGAHVPGKTYELAIKEHVSDEWTVLSLCSRRPRLMTPVFPLGVDAYDAYVHTLLASSCFSGACPYA